MSVDIKRLEQVMAVVQEGSISGAAQILHLTQPALSRSIATLEEQYGFRIFQRDRGGAKLTPMGKSLVAEADLLLRQARSVDHNFKLYKSGEAGQLALGMGPLLASLVLPDLSVEFLRRRPHLRLQAVIRPAGILFEELMADRIEILFCGHEQLNQHARISSTRIGQIEVGYIVRAEHPLAQKRKISQQDLAPYPLLVGAEPQSSVFGGYQNVFICDNYHILHQTVQQTDGVWISSPTLVKEDIDTGRLKVLTLTDNERPSVSDVYHVFRKDYRLSPGAQATCDFVADFLSSAD